MGTSDARLQEIAAKVEARERLTFDDGVALYRSADLNAIGRLADRVNRRRNGTDVFFNVNRHINPTNACVYRCSFCGFRRDLSAPDAYLLTPRE